MASRSALLVILLALTVVAQPQRMRCRVGDRQVYVSQPTAYEVTIRASGDIRIVEPPKMAGLLFELVSEGARGTGSIIINGRRRDFTEWGATWRVTPDQPGRFDIAPPKVTLAGKVVPGSSVVLTAAPPPTQDLIKVEMTTTATEAVVGQAVELTVDVLMKHLPKPAPQSDPLYYHSPRSRMAAPQVLLPWLPKPPFGDSGFDANFWGRNEAGIVTGGGKGLRLAGFRTSAGFTGEVVDVKLPDGAGVVRQYRRYRFRVALRADRPGAFDVARVIVDGQVANKAGGGFEPKHIYARSEPLVVTVSEPPVADRPAEYSGAVGSFAIKAQAPTPNVVNVGSPVYMTVVVEGDGFLDGVHVDLAKQLGADWRVGEPRITDSLKPGEEPPQGFPNRPGTWRQFDFKLRPLKTEIVEVPKIAFAYYDVKKKAYATATTDVFPLEVRAAGVAVDEGVVDATGGRKGATELVASGLSANEDDLNKLANQRVATWPFVVIGLSVLPLWLFAGALVARRRALRADPAILRRKNARGRAVKNLKAARAEGSVAAAVAALCGLVADLEDRPDDAVTSGDVASWLDTLGLTAELRAALDELLDAGEAATFGGGALDTAALTRALDAAEVAIAETPRAGVRAVVLLVALFGVAPTLTAQDTNLFQEAQAAFTAGNYAESAALYERMLTADYENGFVLYNLGNAWLQAGEVGRALSAYRRAAWYLPRDANLERNLTLALDRRRQNLADKDDAVVDKILFWRRGLSFSMQAWLALAALLTAAACSLTRTVLGRPIPALRTATIVMLVVTALFVTSASLSHADQVSKAHGAVTTDDTSLLQWPAADADLSYEQPLHDGDEFSIVTRREGWLKIRIADRYEGWIDASRAVTW